MSQKVSTNDGLLNIGNDKNPQKWSSEAKVEGKGPLLIVTYGSIVHC